MKLENILNHINYQKIINNQNHTINKIKIDTRKIEVNDLFIGIKGDNVDGNKLYKEAFLKGATISIIENIEETEDLIDYLKKHNKTIIIVKNTIKTLGELAAYKRTLYKGKTIGITGSSGKTSTKDIIYSILNTKYKVYKTKGNLNNEIGLPLSILEANLDNDYFILEMGMNHLGEISYLSELAKPDIVVITNIGSSHIGNLGSRENILKAKLEILDGLQENGTIIINNDNDLLHDWYLKNKNNYNIKTIGIDNDSDFQAENIELHETCSKFTIYQNNLKINIGGIHFIYNALIGYAIGKLEKVDFNNINLGLKNLTLSQNRMNVIEKNGIKIINDCYNSNYDSCKYSLKYLGTCKGRKIAVLGTMLELGDYSNYYHTLLGDKIVSENIDILITVGEYTNLINEHAIELGFNKENSYHYNDNFEVTNIINNLKQENDVILIKASHSMNFIEIVNNVKV